MKKTSMIFSGVTILVVSFMMFSSESALAYKGNPSVKGPNFTEERHAEMEKAFETKNYTAWKNLMAGRGRVTQVVNAQNFARFAQAHELAEQGKVNEANKIKTELGLGLQNGSGVGQGMGFGKTNK